MLYDLNKLKKIADRLDSVGLYNEASEIDSILVCLAMSYEDARALLGVSEDATPEEISQAYLPKALEHHPDRGGDLETMQQLNHARDILLGKSQPQRMRPDQTPQPQRQEYRSYEPDPEKTVKTSWDEAAAKAGVPSDVTWKFKTQSGYSPYLGDKSMFGFVVYGESEGRHVFVGVYNSKERNYITGLDINVYDMWVEFAAKSEDISAYGPKVIRRLWKNFEGVGGPKANVVMLGDLTEFSESISYASGDNMSYKQAMHVLGYASLDNWKKGKLNVSINSSQPGGWDTPYVISIIINGKPFELTEESSKLMEKSGILRAMFKEYPYTGSKSLNRLRKGKKMMEWLSEKLADKEPQELSEALKAAADQKK